MGGRGRFAGTLDCVIPNGLNNRTPGKDAHSSAPRLNTSRRDSIESTSFSAVATFYYTPRLFVEFPRPNPQDIRALHHTLLWRVRSLAIWLMCGMLIRAKVLAGGSTWQTHWLVSRNEASGHCPKAEPPFCGECGRAPALPVKRRALGSQRDCYSRSYDPAGRRYFIHDCRRRVQSAKLVGRDPGTDIAVLKAEIELPGAAPGRANAVNAGELALVLGRSPQSGANASFGIVSAASGPWKTWLGGELDAYVRLDARLFPQSSGGAVVSMQGRNHRNCYFSSLANCRPGGPLPRRSREWRNNCSERGFVPRGYLGIGVQPVPLPEELQKSLSIANKGGLMLLTRESGSPADKPAC